MPHNTNSLRVYRGEKEAARIVQWLNAARDAGSTKSYSRVAEIHGLLLKLDSYSTEWQPAHRKPELLNRDNKKYGQILAESYETAEQLNRLLRSYRMHPEVGPRLGEGGVYLNWTSGSARSKWGFTVETDDSRQTVQGKPVQFPGLRTLVTEPRVVLLLIELARSRSISRVARCEQCETWYYARFLHAKFCSKQCQQAHFRTSEDFKRHKREYMRELRQKHKSRSFK